MVINTGNGSTVIESGPYRSDAYKGLLPHSRRGPGPVNTQREHGDPPARLFIVYSCTLFPAGSTRPEDMVPVPVQETPVHVSRAVIFFQNRITIFQPECA